MKKYLFFAFSAFWMIQAECAPSMEQAKASEKEPKEESCSALRFGASYTYVRLKPTGFSFHGSLGGLQAIYEYTPRNSLYEALKFSWRQGCTHQNAMTRFLLDIDTQERIGYTFACDQNYWKMSLFTGFGFRYLGHTLKQPALSTLNFHYREFYVPVGFLFSGSICADVSMGLNCIWMPQVFPSVSILPLGGTHWSIRRTFANILVEMPIVYTPWGGWLFELKPFFEFWQDGSSYAAVPGNLSLGLPKNTYLFAGAELNAGLEF